MSQTVRKEFFGENWEKYAASISPSDCRSLNLTHQELSLVLVKKAILLSKSFYTSDWTEISEIWNYYAEKTTPEIRAKLQHLTINQLIDNKSDAKCMVLFIAAETYNINLCKAGSSISLFQQETRVDEWLSGAKWTFNNCCQNLRSRAPYMSPGAEGCIAAGVIQYAGIQLIDDLMELWTKLDEDSKVNLIKYSCYANNQLGVEFLVRLLESDIDREAHFGLIVTALIDMPGDQKRHTGSAYVTQITPILDPETGYVVPNISNLCTFKEYLPKIRSRIEDVNRKITNKLPIELAISAWCQNGFKKFAVEKLYEKPGCLPLLILIGATTAALLYQFL